jgi:hypothetical protein
MAEENGKPKMGSNARLLAVRPTIDIDVEQVPKDCSMNKIIYYQKQNASLQRSLSL